MVPVGRLHQQHRFGSPDTAGRALAAALFGEKSHHVERGIAGAIVLAEHDHSGRSDEAAMGLKRVEVERNVGHASRQDPARCSARQIGAKGMPLEHAATVFVDQFACSDAGRRQLDPRLTHPTADAEAAQAASAVSTESAEPGGASLEDVAHPEEGLEIVLKRRPSEETDFCDVGRAHAGFAALALDAFDHRRLFAADVGTCAAAQLDARQRAGRIGLQAGDLILQDRPAAVVLVAQIEVAGLDANRHRGYQHALEKSVRITLEIGPVLEGARLALVDIDGHQPWAGLPAHDPPFATSRETRAAQAAQARIFHGGDQVLRVVVTRRDRLGERIAALREIALEADIVGGDQVLRTAVGDRLLCSSGGIERAAGGRVRMRAGPIDHGLRDRVEAGAGHRILMDDCHRRLLASAHAGRRDDPDIVATQHLRQTCEQRGRAGEFAAQAFADPHGQRRRGSIALEHLEVVIESRDLIDLGHRYRHVGCQCHQMMIAQPPVLIIEPMQMLDQQISPMRSVADQGAHLRERLVVGLTALELAAAANLLTHVRHGAKRDSGDRGRSHAQRTSNR